MEQSREKETAAMLIRFFNMQAGTSFRFGTQATLDVVIGALNRTGDDVAFIKNHIREWAVAHASDPEKNISACFDSIPAKEVAHPVTEPVQTPAPVTEQAVGTAMGLLERAVVGLIAKTSAEKIEAEILGSVQNTIQDFIKKEYGSIERKVVTVIDGQPKSSKVFSMKSLKRC